MLKAEGNIGVCSYHELPYKMEGRIDWAGFNVSTNTV